MAGFLLLLRRALFLQRLLRFFLLFLLLVQVLGHDGLRWLGGRRGANVRRRGAAASCLAPASPYTMRMTLISLNAVDYSVGGPLLLERVDLAIATRERLALPGRHGDGDRKSDL